MMLVESTAGATYHECMGRSYEYLKRRCLFLTFSQLPFATTAALAVDFPFELQWLWPGQVQSPHCCLLSPETHVCALVVAAVAYVMAVVRDIFICGFYYVISYT